MTTSEAPGTPRWQVACLCAGWCRTCDAYRATFDELATEFDGLATFRWIDIEDEADLVGDLDIDNFPTLLVASAEATAFFGTVLPHAQSARALIERALAGTLTAARPDASVAALARALQRR